MEDCLGHGGPGGNRCMGKPEATGIIDPALAPGGEHEKISLVWDFSLCLAAGVKRSALEGVFFSTWWGRGPTCGERGFKGGSTPVHHSTVAPCFCGSLGFLHKHSLLRISSLPSPQDVSLQPTAVFPLGLLSNPHIPALSPHEHQQTHVPVWGGQDCGLDHL